jgi:RecA/RadA recombinase
MIFPASKLNELFKNISVIKGLFSCYGDFGVGKTTFAIQTALNSLVPQKNILYIYTKPELPIEKIKNISELYTPSLTPKLMENLKLIKISDFKELFKASFNFEFLLLNGRKSEKNLINLIIIDSLTDLYKINLNPTKKEQNVKLNYQLHHLLANLKYLNNKYELEILLINESSKDTINGILEEIPSGGAVMDYWISYSLKIERTEILNRRKLILFQPNQQIPLKFELDMTKNGFKDAQK